MVTIAHLINIVAAKHGTDWYDVQKATTTSMDAARRTASNLDIELLALPGAGETAGSIPGFRILPSLTRNIGDIREFQHKRPLPLLKDILDTFISNTNADYLIYTNADITLQPHFYQEVLRLIEKGHDAIVINRRTIPDSPRKVEDLSLHEKISGIPHPGYDCFIFKRELYQQFILGNVCLGIGHVDLPLICSMIASAESFILIKDAHLTFHFGNPKTWRSSKFRDYSIFNDREAAHVVLQLASRSKKVMRPWHRLLLSIPLIKNSFVVNEFLRLFP